MPRATTGKVHHKRAKKVLKDAKGFRGARSVLYRTAKDARRRALENSFEHRRQRKRDMRSLWIQRINAAARMCGISYSQLMFKLDKNGIEIDRKMLADMAMNDFNAFQKMVEKANA